MFLETLGYIDLPEHRAAAASTMPTSTLRPIGSMSHILPTTPSMSSTVQPVDTLSPSRA